MTFSFCIYLSLLFTLFGATGCSDLLKQPAPAKALFSIEPGLPDATTTTSATQTLVQVRTVRVSAPFDGAAFVYQTAPSQYALDYYNNFVASPSALLTERLLAWLEKAGPLRAIGSGAAMRADLILECEIDKLLIDFSDRSNPHAVIAARFLLHGNRTGKDLVLLDTSYEVSTPVTLKHPAGYSFAWGMAFREILQKLQSDIHRSL